MKTNTFNFDPIGLDYKELFNSCMRDSNWFSMPLLVEKALKAKHSNRLFKMWNFAIRHADYDGWFKYSQSIQVEDWGISRRACQNEILFFEKMGWIKRDTNHKGETIYSMLGDGLCELFKASQDKDKDYFLRAKEIYKAICYGRDKEKKQKSVRDSLIDFLIRNKLGKEEAFMLLDGIDIVKEVTPITQKGNDIIFNNAEVEND